MSNSTHHRLRAALCAALALAALAGCAGAKKGSKAAISVILTAAHDCNDCGSGPAAVKYRVLQVADVDAIRTALNKGLPWAKQLEAAGTNVLVNAGEDFINPDSTRTLVAPLDPKATAVVVEGNFCKRVGSTWYVVQPLLKKKGPVRVKIGATGITVVDGK